MDIAEHEAFLGYNATSKQRFGLEVGPSKLRSALVAVVTDHRQ